MCLYILMNCEDCVFPFVGVVLFGFLQFVLCKNLLDMIVGSMYFYAVLGTLGILSK